MASLINSSELSPFFTVCFFVSKGKGRGRGRGVKGVEEVNINFLDMSVGNMKMHFLTQL